MENCSRKNCTNKAAYKVEVSAGVTTRICENHYKQYKSAERTKSIVVVLIGIVFMSVIVGVLIAIL